MRKIHLLGTTVGVAMIVAACGEVATKECNITTQEQQRQGKVVTAKFEVNVDCEEMRKLAEQGQPLPTFGSPVTKDAPTVQKTPDPIDVSQTPTVPGTTGGATELIPTTNKQERQQELTQKLPPATENRDPFAGIKGTIPGLPDLKPRIINIEPPPGAPGSTPGGVEVAPPPPPPPPDTSAAQAVAVTGVFKIGGDQFVILQAQGSTALGYVKVGDQIPGTPVTVSGVNVVGDKATVILEQNGVKVEKEINLIPTIPEKTQA